MSSALFNCQIAGDVDVLTATPTLKEAVGANLGRSSRTSLRDMPVEGVDTNGICEGGPS